MERVTGIGGLFFRADDPKALARWYQHIWGSRSHQQATRNLPGSKRRAPRFSLLFRIRGLFRGCPQDVDGELLSA